MIEKDRFKEMRNHWLLPVTESAGKLNSTPDEFNFMDNMREADTPLCHLCFRKRILIDDVKEKAIANIPARTLYKLHINGKFIMTGPARSPENYLFVDSVNVSEHLRKGENIIAMEILYLGPRGEYDFGAPGFTFYLDSNGKKTFSDESWKCRDWQAYLPKSEAGKLRCYPAEMLNLTKIDLTWTSIDYDDSGWNEAGKLYEVTKSSELRQRPMLLPELKLMPEPVIIDCGRKLDDEYVSGGISANSAKATFHFEEENVFYLYDFGSTVSGFFEIEAKLPNGVVLQCEYLEWLDRFDGSSCRKNCYGAGEKSDGFSLVGDGMRFSYQTWHPYSCRYMRVTVKGLKPGEKARLVSIGARELCSLPSLVRSQTCCSDPALEKIIDAAQKTMRVCAPDLYVDCSSHERRIYLHDSLWEIEAGNIFFGDSSISQTYLEMFPDCAGDVPAFPSMPGNGTLCCRGAKRKVTLGHCLTWILQGFVHYEFCGQKLDGKFLKAAKAMLDDIHKVVTSEGLIEFRDDFCMFLDWSKMFVEEGISVGMNALYYKALKMMASVTNDNSLKNRADTLRIALRGMADPFINGGQMRMGRLVPDMFTREKGKLEPFLCEQSNAFGDKVRYPRSETTQNWLLWSGVLDEKYEERLWEVIRTFRINEEPRLDDNRLYNVARSGIFGLWPRLAYALSRRDAEVVYRDLRDLCGPMVTIGDTLWESACADSRSNAHGFAAYAGTLLFKCMTGILPGSKKGYEQPIIAPLPGDLIWGRGLMRTKQGIIGVNWQNKVDSFTLTVSLPKGMKATIILPPQAAAIMSIKGDSLKNMRYEIIGTAKFQFSTSREAIISLETDLI